jgi:alkylhydroperoxidase family enzyme
MARVNYLNASDVQPDERELFRRGLNLYRVLAHSPQAARNFQSFARFLRYESRLDPRLRELAILQIGYLTRTGYSFYGHAGIVAPEFGVTEDDIRNMICETQGVPSNLEPLASTVIRAAREVTTEFEMSDETFTALEAELDEAELVDLVSTIAFYNAAIRFIKTMQIDVEPQRLAAYAKAQALYPFSS